MSIINCPLSINPTYKDALYNVSLLLFKLKRLSDAIDFGIEISKIEKGTSELNAFYAARNMLWMWNFQEGLDFCNDWLKKYYQAASIIKFSYQSKKTFEDDIDNKIKNFYNNTNQTESFFDFEHDA